MRDRRAHCDSQARAGFLIVWLMGAMGLVALVGLLWLGTQPNPSPIILTALAGVITGSMSGLPALLGRLSNQATEPAKSPSGAQEVLVTNPASDPVQTEEAKP